MPFSVSFYLVFRQFGYRCSLTLADLTPFHHLFSTLSEQTPTSKLEDLHQLNA